MKVKKTWLGYAIWGLFSLVLFSNIGFSAIAIERSKGTGEILIPLLLMFIYVCGGTAAVIFGYKAFMHYLYPKFNKGEAESGSSLIEYLFLFLTMFVATMLRLAAVLLTNGTITGNNQFFDLANGTITSGAFQHYTNGIVIYNGFLQFIFDILGYKPLVIFAVNAVLQLAVLLIVFFGVRFILGKVQGWITYLLLAFLPGVFLQVSEVTPGMIFAVIFILFFIALGIIAKQSHEQKIRSMGCGFFFVILGMVAALLCYYDVSGVIAFLLGIFSFLLIKNEDSWSLIQKPFIQILFYIAGFAVTLLLLLWFVPLNGVNPGTDSLIAYGMQFVPQNGIDFMLITPNAGNWDCVIILIFALVWFFAYVRGENGFGSIFAIIIIALSAISFATIDVFSNTFLYSFAWIMLASTGVCSMPAFMEQKEMKASVSQSQQKREQRKKEREMKRSAAAGEKSINLAEVNAKTQKSRFTDDYVPSSGKGYGIGMRVPEAPAIPKEDDNKIEVKPKEKTVTVDSVPVREISESLEIKEDVLQNANELSFTDALKSEESVTETEMIKEVFEESHEEALTEEIKTSAQGTVDITVNTESEDSEEQVVENEFIQHEKEDTPVVSDTETRNTEVTDAPEIAETSAVSQEEEQKIREENTKPEYRRSPARRGYRYPSKTTFSPEELERIKAYTNGEFVVHTADETSTKQNNVGTAQETLNQIASENQEPVSVEKQNAVIAQDENHSEKESDTETKENAVVLNSTKRIENENKTTEEKVIKNEEVRKPKLIRNPLPGPKPHVAREFNYDFVPDDKDMDFDLKDMSGKDFYDI